MYYYLFMSETLKAIECEQCGEVRSSATMHSHEGLDICDDCWPAYCEENGICESCGEPLPPIYENNGFTEPEGPSHWEVVGYKPCVECNQPDDQE